MTPPHIQKNPHPKPAITVSGSRRHAFSIFSSSPGTNPGAPLLGRLICLYQRPLNDVRNELCTQGKPPSGDANAEVVDDVLIPGVYPGNGQVIGCGLPMSN